jgi:predicted dehydrogenase
VNVPVRVGAVGCGRLSQTIHFPAIRSIPELSLVALCDIDPDRLSAAASRFGVADTFADYEEMLDACHLDAVSIVGPPALHVLAVRACLRRGIPFMVEKPLALNVADAEMLADEADRHGNCGQVAFTSRFTPAQRLAWRIARSSEFGPITYVATTHLTECTMSPCWDKTDPVEGFIHLHGVHAIDLWRFFGGDPTQVGASVTGQRPVGDGVSFYGSILAYVRSENGPHGTIHMKAGASHSGDINSDVVGERSRVRVENDQDVTYEPSKAQPASEWMADDLVDPAVAVHQPAGHFLGAGLFARGYQDFFRMEWVALARSLLAGRELSPTIQDGAKTVYLTEAICASLRDGGALQPVRYPAERRARG